MTRLVSSIDQLVTNIRRYNKNAQKFAELMPYNRAWYALQTEDGWLLGPSKYVGYSELSPEAYLRDARHLNGRVTEGVLQRWANLVEEGHPHYEELHTTLNELCGKHGKKPNTLARISIIRTGTEVEPPLAGDDLVALLAAVFRGLTPAQKSAFRKLAE